MENIKETDATILLKRQLWLTGKAPLASFEDLPTDEQNSSSCSTCNNSPTAVTEDNFGKCLATKKQEITVVVTDHDNVNDKNNFKDGKSNQFKAEFIGSEQFLSLPVPGKETTRKGSWTDFFFLKKSPTKSKRKFSLFPFKFTFKDDKKQTDNSIIDSTSIDDRSSSSLSPDCFQLKHLNADEQSSLTSADTVVYINNDEKGTSSGKKSVKNEIIEIGQALTDEDFPLDNRIDLSDTKKPIKEEKILLNSKNDDNKTDIKIDSPIDNVLLNNTNVAIEKNIQIVNDHYHKCNEPCHDDMLECRGECSECDSVVLSCDCMNNESDIDMAADNEDNDCHDECESRYDSYELIMLVKNDELDLNQKLNQSSTTIEEPIPNPTMQKTKPSTLKVNFDSCNKNIKISPIERPHSIIPVNNMDNFEAYLRNLSNTINQTKNEDKLKIILPGEEFAQENGEKFLKNRPRKSNPFIWQEFCEKGLKSPQVLRKRANSCFPGISENVQLDVEPNKDIKYDNNDDNGSICSPNENLTPITPIKNLNLAEEEMFGDKDFCTMALLGKRIPLQFKCNNEFSFECNCSCTSSITSSTTSSNNNFKNDNKNNRTIYSENIFSTEVTSDENEPQTDNHNKLQQDLNAKDICKTEFSEDHPLVSPCTCICHRITSRSSTIGKELIKKNREFTSDEITDLCLLSSSSTLSSSPSITTSCSSSSSTASSPAS